MGNPSSSSISENVTSKVSKDVELPELKPCGSNLSIWERKVYVLASVLGVLALISSQRNNDLVYYDPMMHCNDDFLTD